MRKLLALGLAMMMVMALSSVALASGSAACMVTFTILNMDETDHNDATLDIQDYDGPGHTGSDDNTYMAELQQDRHYDVHVQGAHPPYKGYTMFFTGSEANMDVTIYVAYDEGSDTRVFFEVTDAVGVSLHAHQNRVSIRTGAADFPAIKFDARIDHAGPDEVYEGEITAFTMDNDGDWTVVPATPEAGQIAFEFSPDDSGYVPFHPAGHDLSDFVHDENHGHQQDFWLKGITSTDTPANTMGNVYFRLEVTLIND